jgi:hypothetical protein
MQYSFASTNTLKWDGMGRYGIIQLYLAFEVLTAGVKKRFIFWDITPSSPFKVNRGTCRRIIW